MVTTRTNRTAHGPRAVKRSENTAKILDAAIKCLNKEGYAGTTLLAVAEAAGVSRGQVQNIFGLKRTDLLTRIAEEIFGRYVQVYAKAIDAATNPAELTDRMWDAIQSLYARPETLALIEIWLATRNDRSFNRKLRVMMVEIDSQLNARWAESFSDAGLDADLIPVIRYFQRGIMRGLAIERLLGLPETVVQRIIDEARVTTLAMLNRGA